MRSLCENVHTVSCFTRLKTSWINGHSKAPNGLVPMSELCFASSAGRVHKARRRILTWYVKTWVSDAYNLGLRSQSNKICTLFCSPKALPKFYQNSHELLHWQNHTPKQLSHHFMNASRDWLIKWASPPARERKDKQRITITPYIILVLNCHQTV